MLFPINLFNTIYTGQASNNGPSAKLWSQMRNVGIGPAGFARGYYAGSEFMGFGGLLTSTAGDYADEGGSYMSYQDAAATITAVAGTGGQITITTDGTDNLEAWLQYSKGGTLGAFNTTDPKLTIFEARVKFSTQIASGNSFVGLAEEGFAANNGISDAGVMADKDFFGFLIKEGAPSTLLIVYGKQGGTAGPTTLATYGTITVDTFYNLGLIYNPFAEASKRIAFYVDGARQTTYGTTSTLADADFPLGEEMTFTAGVKNSTTTARPIVLDWWHWWQEA